MHRKKIQRFIGLAALVFCVTGVSGCGSRTETTEREALAQEENTEEETAEEETSEDETESEEVFGPAFQEKGEEENSSEEKEETVTPTPEGEEESDSPEGTLSAPSDKSEGGSVFGGSGNSGAASQADEKLQSLMSSLSFPEGNGSWSAYVYDTVGQAEGSVNEHQMQAASLIKLYIMGAVYENYETLTARYGQSSVDSYLNSMITVSDNDAANTLVSYLGNGDSSAGMQTVNQFCSNQGYVYTHMGRLLLASNELDDNYTSVGDCGKFLLNVYNGNALGDSICQAEFQLLAAQTRRNKIPAQMPEGVSVANKTGELDNVENDAGIIYNTSNDLIVVFMSENLSETGSAQSTIASLSRQIYDYYS